MFVLAQEVVMPNHSRDSAPVRAGVYTRISWDPPGKGAGVERQRVDCEALCASREPLRAELELAHRCGAERLTARAVEELWVSGVRPRRPVNSGPNALTAGEARVAGLAASGKSNREIAQHLSSLPGPWRTS